MGVYRAIETFLLNLLQWAWFAFVGIHEVKNIVSKRRLVHQVRLTDEQKRQIDRFYLEHYGRKIPYWWHRLYMSYTGKFDYKYLPEYIFTMKIEPKTNARNRVMQLENKNMLEAIFVKGEEDVRAPETYLMCVDGKYIDGSGRFLSREDAIHTLRCLHDGEYTAVVKATVDTSSGRNVHIIRVQGGEPCANEDTWERLFDKMGRNFVVQEQIQPHPAFAALYPRSINTLRVITYRCGESVYTAPILMRIGQGGGVVDNAHAGGMFIGVDDEGRLMPEAYTEYQKRYRKHPDTGIIFEGYRLPEVEHIRRCAKRLHMRVPMLDFVSWDFTVDSRQRIVLVEANLHSQAVWMSQISHGASFFGENTEAMLYAASGKGKIKRLS